MSSMSAVSAPPANSLDAAYLASLAGDDDVDLSNGYDNPFKQNVAYPVMFLSQTLKTTDKGLTMMFAKVQQILPNGKGGIQTQLSYVLPLYGPQAKDNYSEDTLDTMKKINCKGLDSLLRAVFPSTFTGDAKTAGKVVLGATKRIAMSDAQINVVGKRCYYARILKGKAKNPSDVFFAAQPKDVPLAQ